MKEKIQERMEYLEDLIDRKEKELEKMPQDVVNICRHGNRVQYYKKNVVTKYLKVMQDEYPETTCEDVYSNLNPDRKLFVNPITLSDDEFVAKWLQQEYVPKGFAPDAPEYYTDNGERVRSKSEILIANALKKHNIPYKYEVPLYLKGFGTIHPDFTVLNVKLRKEYYWEHMGMMDDSDYIDRALQRIELYEKNDYFPGDKLIISHETMKSPINPRNIDKMIAKYLA